MHWKNTFCFQYYTRKDLSWDLWGILEKLTLGKNWHLVPVANSGRHSLVLQLLVDPLLVGSVASTFLVSHTKILAQRKYDLHFCIWLRLKKKKKRICWAIWSIRLPSWFIRVTFSFLASPIVRPNNKIDLWSPYSIENNCFFFFYASIWVVLLIRY